MLVKNITLITRIFKTGTYCVIVEIIFQHMSQMLLKVLRHRPQYRDVTFGELTAIDGSSPCKWECKCSCGRTTSREFILTRSCGHLETEKLLPSKIVDISGQKFGELTSIEPFFHPTRKRVAWHCLCSCGKEYDAVATDLTSGDVISCGHLSQSYNVATAT